ncbi:MAG: hypothetical protein JXP73_21725 [Deltaproteobacteria bacterium]|nr:hypothetical protein [Deltaproteobacteria bacterium]
MEAAVARSTDRRADWGTWLALAMAALGFAYALYVHRHFIHDDAFICFRYAERLLDGKGLTWNDGERVEGFSSPAWLAQIAVLARLGIAAPLAALGLGLAYALALMVLWRRARAAPIGLLALLTVPGFAMWTWGGLETISACFWLLAGVHLVRGMRSRALSRNGGLLLGGALAALAQSRPEGIAVAAALLAAAWPSRRQSGFAVAAVILGAVFASYEVFRLAYFGDFIANGARAKTLGLPVWERVQNATIYVAGTARQWLGCVLVSLWLLATTPGRRSPGWLLLPLAPLVLAIFVGGGDHMAGARLLLAPVALLCFAACLAPPSPRPVARHAAVGLAIAAALWQLRLSARNPAPRDPAAAVGEIVGHALAGVFPRGTWVASATAGSVPYFAPSLSFIDTLGLNDRHIAHRAPTPLPAVLHRPDSWTDVPGHQRGDGTYVLSRRPDIILLGGANGTLAPWFATDYQLLLAEDFRAQYAPWGFSVEVPENDRRWVEDELDADSGRLPVTLYVRRDSPARVVVAASASPVRPLWDSP